MIRLESSLPRFNQHLSESGRRIISQEQHVYLSLGMPILQALFEFDDDFHHALHLHVHQYFYIHIFAQSLIEVLRKQNVLSINWCWARDKINILLMDYAKDIIGKSMILVVDYLHSSVHKLTVNPKQNILFWLINWYGIDFSQKYDFLMIFVGDPVTNQKLSSRLEQNYRALLRLLKQLQRLASLRVNIEFDRPSNSSFLLAWFLGSKESIPLNNLARLV